MKVLIVDEFAAILQDLRKKANPSEKFWKVMPRCSPSILPMCVKSTALFTSNLGSIRFYPEVKKMQFMLPKDFKEFIRTRDSSDSSDSKFLHQTSACFVGCFGACGSKQIIATGAAPPMRSASAVASCPQFIGKFQPVTSKIVRSSVKFLWEISRIRFPY